MARPCRQNLRVTPEFAQPPRNILYQGFRGEPRRILHCVERASRMSPQNVRLKRPRSRPFPVRVGLRGRMRTGPSRTSKSAAPYGHPAGSRVSQRDALHPSTPRCESIWRRRSATANSTLTRRTCAECSPPRVSLYSMLGCELKKARSAPAPSTSVHMPFWCPSAGQRTTHNAKSERHHEGPYKRCRSGPGH